MNCVRFYGVFDSQAYGSLGSKRTVAQDKLLAISHLTWISHKEAAEFNIHFGYLVMA